MPLELVLVKVLVAERTELGCQAAKCLDQRELRRDQVGDTIESHLFRKLESCLGFTLHLRQSVSGREQIGVQVIAAKRRKSQVAGTVRGIESAPHQLSSCLDVPPPR